MKKGLLILSLLFFPFLSQAAISYDNDIDTSGSGATLTQSLTIDTCDNRMLYVWASTYKAGGTTAPTGVTYDGFAMTQFSTENTFLSGQIKENVWFLADPNAGTNDIVITAGTTADEIGLIAVSYCGVVQESPSNIDRFNTTATNHESTLTVLENSWLAIVGRNRINTMSTYGSGSNTLRMQAAALAYGDSNGPLAAGSASIGLGTTGSSEFGSWAWEIEEAVESTPPVATSTATSTNEILYSDWLFVNGVIIFLLSFMAWGLLFSPFKKK